MAAIPLFASTCTNLTDSLNQLIAEINNAPGGANGPPLPVLQGGTGTTSLSGLIVAGGGLLAANNLSDLTNASTARSNLSLGSLAVLSSINNSNWSGTGLTYANMQSVTASRLLGNPTGAGAVPSEITLGATLTFSGSALQTTAHTSDVTSPANSNVMTIAANAVTVAKMQQLAALSVLGNSTNATANMAAITGTANQLLSVNAGGTALGFVSAINVTTINKLTLTTPATGSTLTIADTKTLTCNNSLTLAGTDATTITFQGTDTYVGRATTDTLTNKTFDTGGTGNSLKIAGTAITSISGNTAKVVTTTGVLTSGHMATWDASGNAIDGGAPFSGGLLAANNLSDLGTLSTALSNLGFTSSPSTSGYFKSAASGGTTIVQYGSGTTAGGTLAVSFPTSFPTRCSSVVVNFTFAGNSQLSSNNNAMSTTGFTAYVSNANSGGSGGAIAFNWIAIGN